MQADRGPTSSSSRLVQLVVFLCFLINAQGGKHPPSFPSTDDRALLAFKSKFDLHTSLPFNASSSHCHWLGVSCATVDGTTRVIKLILENLPLGGPIPPNTLTRLDQLRLLSLKNSSLTGPIPDLSGLINLKVLFLSHNSFTGHFPPSISSLHRLRTIDLSHNNFTDTLPSFLSQLDRLTYLRLDSNHFNGSLPPLNQSSLSTFNVSFNNLSGPVPITTTFVRFGHSAFVRNPSLCGEIVHKECRPKIPFFGPAASEPTTAAAAPGSGTGLDQNEQMAAGLAAAQHGEGGNRNSRRLVLGFVIGVLGLVTALLCFTFAVKRSRRKKNPPTTNGYYHQHGSEEHAIDRSAAAADAAEVMRIEAEREEKVKTVVSGMKFPAPAAGSTISAVGVEDGGKQVGSGGGGGGTLVFCAGEERLYTVEQLMKGSAELLGRGTMGTTYKAVLDNRLIVCVKRLDGSKMGDEGKEAFERHMEAVGGLRHPNLVPLRAYFQAKEERLLVYDYQPNGSLFSLIHGSKSARAKPLHWTPCLKIAEDVAQGLSYIHQAWRLVHGNLKSSNVLLGPDFEACLTDYCLTPLADDSAFLFNNSSHTDPDSSSSTAYRSPEIRGSIHEATAKSDVYAFGVLLLELLSGKPPHQHPYLAPREIVKWVSKVRGVNGAAAHVGEDDEEEQEEESRLAMLLEVALTCSVSSPEQRPTMWQVLKMLQEIKEAAALVEDHDCDSDPNSAATAPP